MTSQGQTKSNRRNDSERKTKPERVEVAADIERKLKNGDERSHFSFIIKLSAIRTYIENRRISRSERTHLPPGGVYPAFLTIEFRSRTLLEL